MAANDLDYYVWRHDKVLSNDPDKWAWEVVTVDDDGNETTIDGGFSPSEDAAFEAAKNYIRCHH